MKKENNIESKTKYLSNLNASITIILKREGSQLHSTDIVENDLRKET